MARKRLTEHTIYSGEGKALALPVRLRPTAARRAAPPKAPEQQPPSAHPGDENFDPRHAAAVMGDIAEQVRAQLAKDYDARPPGLQTVANGDGSLSVICDDPAAGLGLQVHITQIQPGSTGLAGPAQGGQDQGQMPGMGMGPPPMMPQQMSMPGMGMGPPMMPQQPQQMPQMG